MTAKKLGSLLTAYTAIMAVALIIVLGACSGPDYAAMGHCERKLYLQAATSGQIFLSVFREEGRRIDEEVAAGRIPAD